MRDCSLTKIIETDDSDLQTVYVMYPREFRGDKTRIDIGNRGNRRSKDYTHNICRRSKCPQCN